MAPNVDDSKRVADFDCYASPPPTKFCAQSDTWNRLGNGLSPGEFAPGACAMSPVDADSGRVEEGRLVIDVTACVEALQADPDPQGWALLSTGGDSVRFASSEGSSQTQRPRLQVRFIRNPSLHSATFQQG